MIINRFCFMFGIGLALAALGTKPDAPRLWADDTTGTVVDFDGLKSTTPASWKEEEPQGKLRLKQFRLPKIKDDKADAELTIFRGITGTAEENIARWKAQFIAPEGKTIDDVAKITKLKVSGAELSYLDLSGVYLFKARPFDPNEKAEKRPNYRMLAIHFDGPKNIYHLKLVGPEKTVEQYKKGFDEWLKAFK